MLYPRRFKKSFQISALLLLIPTLTYSGEALPTKIPAQTPKYPEGFGVVQGAKKVGGALENRAGLRLAPQGAQMLVEEEAVEGAEGRKGIWGWVIGTACVVGLGAAYISEEQKKSLTPCLVHTLHTPGAKCNGNSRDCPFGNYVYQNRILPLIQSMGLARSTRMEDFLQNGKFKDYFAFRDGLPGRGNIPTHSEGRTTNVFTQSGVSESFEEGGNEEEELERLFAHFSNYKIDMKRASIITGRGLSPFEVEKLREAAVLQYHYFKLESGALDENEMMEVSDDPFLRQRRNMLVSLIAARDEFLYQIFLMARILVYHVDDFGFLASYQELRRVSSEYARAIRSIPDASSKYLGYADSLLNIWKQWDEKKIEFIPGKEPLEVFGQLYAELVYKHLLLNQNPPTLSIGSDVDSDPLQGINLVAIREMIESFAESLVGLQEEPLDGMEMEIYAHDGITTFTTSFIRSTKETPTLTVSTPPEMGAQSEIQNFSYAVEPISDQTERVTQRIDVAPRKSPSLTNGTKSH